LQVLGVTARSRLPQASVTLMGSGTMEWVRERDRVIHVGAGQHIPSSPRAILTHSCASLVMHVLVVVPDGLVCLWPLLVHCWLTASSTRAPSSHCPKAALHMSLEAFEASTWVG
jgi:hypothetical protein